MEKREAGDGLSILREMYGDSESSSSSDCDDVEVEDQANFNQASLYNLKNSVCEEVEVQEKNMGTNEQPCGQNIGNLVASPHSENLAQVSPHALTPKEPESSGSSGKRKRGDVYLQLQHDEEASKGDRTCKRHKWSDEVYQMKLLGPIKLPDVSKDIDVEAGLDRDFQLLTAKLKEINEKLQALQSANEQFEEVKYYEELVWERQNIIASLIQRDSTFKPPCDDRPLKFQKKLYIPQKEYPGYNFIRLIVGPNGNMLRRMESESGARIFIKGTGSVEEQRRQKREAKSERLESDDLHVAIEANNENSLNAAVTMVEKLLVPVKEKDYYMRTQLEDLPELHGAMTEEMPCRYTEKYIRSSVSMDNICPWMGNGLGSLAPDAGLSKGISRPGDLGHNELQSFSGVSSDIDANVKQSNVVNALNLYVGYLPLSMDEKGLRNMFSPFGRIVSVRIVRDWTTGLSKGYGFVRFSDPLSAAKALEGMDGKKMEGKYLAVRVATRKRAVNYASVSADSKGMQILPPEYPETTTLTYQDPSQSAFLGPTGSVLPDYSSFIQPMAYHTTPVV